MRSSEPDPALLADPLAQIIYRAEMAIRYRAPKYGYLDEPAEFLREVLFSEGVAHAAEAFVEYRSDRKTSAAMWDIGTFPPIPGIVVAPGMNDRVTVLHEAAHIVVTKGPKPAVVGEAHGPEFFAKYTELLERFLPDLAQRFATEHRRLTGLHRHTGILGTALSL